MKWAGTGLAALTLLGSVLAGCSSATTKCDGVEGSVTICADGKPIDFSSLKTKPHQHEGGNLYAPLAVMANALGVTAEAPVVEGKKGTVTVKGNRFDVPATQTVKGIHIHDGIIYVPLKEFAAAGGLKLDMNPDAKAATAAFVKK